METSVEAYRICDVSESVRDIPPNPFRLKLLAGPSMYGNIGRGPINIKVIRRVEQLETRPPSSHPSNSAMMFEGVLVCMILDGELYGLTVSC